MASRSVTGTLTPPVNAMQLTTAERKLTRESRSDRIRREAESDAPHSATQGKKTRTGRYADDSPESTKNERRYGGGICQRRRSISRISAAVETWASSFGVSESRWAAR